MKTNKIKKITSWVLRIIVALGFLLASVGKLTNNPQVIEMFSDWGYPKNFHFVIGILELVLAILILIPKTLKIALIGISIILIGAIGTHIINDPIVEVIRPLVFTILIIVIYYLNFNKNNTET